MAILGSVEVTISSGGKTLQEHEPGADDDAALIAYTSSPGSSTIVKYIEAVSGAPFQIDYVVKKGQSFHKGNLLSLSTYIDGAWVISPIVTKENLDKSRTSHCSFSRRGVETGTGSERKVHPFFWQELSTTDQKPDGTMAEMKEKYGQIGTIKIEVSRQTGHTDQRPDEPKGNGKGRERPGSTNNPIPEKVLKGRAVDMGFSLREAEPIKDSTYWVGETVEKGPVAVFIFLYRSKNALQVLDVIPRSPSPVPLEERDPDTLTREEALELLRRQRAEQEAFRVKIKMEEEAEKHLRRLAGTKREASAEEDEEVSVVATTNKKLRTDLEVVELSD